MQERRPRDRQEKGLCAWLSIPHVFFSVLDAAGVVGFWDYKTIAKGSREMGLAPKLPLYYPPKKRKLQPWCLSHFRDGPTELVMVREKGDRHCEAHFPAIPPQI